MPKRRDIESILIIGSGPIIIGQACEFDYSGTQACKALAQEGYKVILVNSNPATIMTDPALAYRTYVEPIVPETVEAIIRRERPHAVLPTLGGQTALNVAVALARAGVLERHGVELIGANQEAIERAEDRDKFKEVVESCGLSLPRSGYAHSEEEAWEIVEELGYPVVLRPSFTLGGTGGNVAYNQEEFREFVQWAIRESPEKEVLVEESVIGWKEFELEVMRDKIDNVAVICSIENLDPMGIHTGDSITVAPAQTLTDREYQRMRDAALAIIRAVGVETGGSNIQFAINPEDGRMLVIEMNPRVSRSSALASKATGYPIAKIAAKLAVGLTLDEIPNDITLKTPASFEPAIDYCVVKFPRFAFEKFPEAQPVLGTQMRSVGEVMAIGRNFREALGKAIRSLETGRYGLEEPDGDFLLMEREDRERAIREALKRVGPDRIWHVARAFRGGLSIQECYALTAIDPWFLRQVAEVVAFEETLRGAGSGGLTPSLLRRAKEHGFSDASIGGLTGLTEEEVRALRRSRAVKPVFKRVDTCAAEFEAYTPYLYSSYEEECEARPTGRRKVMILGSGPNRIGQGIEFDYCCVHAALAFAEADFESIMVNCNPETVSTDYDISHRLYFEPLTLEDVLAIIEVERPEGVVVQFGGQTPLKLAEPLAREGVRIFGTSVESIDRTEDRERFGELIQTLGLNHTEYGVATSYEEAREVAESLDYPVVVRPSYVLGGRAMRIVYDAESLREYILGAVEASPERPILIDKFIEEAIEIDVDAVADGEDAVVAGVMEHIEEAGVHSGDSACSLPAYSISPHMVEELKRQTRLIAKELGVVGLINIQFALKGGKVYVLEVNPRASRTVPFVSKATGVPLAKVAARVMAGATLKELGIAEDPSPSHVAVKEAVFPFKRFPGVDTLLGPEMKSTGEVMGIDLDFPMAFIKAQMGAGVSVPRGGRVFLSVKDGDKAMAVAIAKELLDQGFEIVATRGTWEAIRGAGLKAEFVKKVKEGRPHIVDRMINGEVDLVINTTFGRASVLDSYSIRRTALNRDIFYCTTIPGALAAIRGIRALQERSLQVKPLQSYYSHEAMSLAVEKVVG